MSAKTFELSEDWVVVILGFGIIGLALLGFVVLFHLSAGQTLLNSLQKYFPDPI